MRKITAMLAILMALLMVLCSCGNTGSNESTPGSVDTNVSTDDSANAGDSVGSDVVDGDGATSEGDIPADDDNTGNESTDTDAPGADTNSNAGATTTGKGGKGTTTTGKGGKNTTTKKTTTKNQDNITTSIKADGTVDMGGYEFILGTAYYSNYLNSEGVLDPTNPVIKAINSVEKDYNCKVKFYRFADVGAAGEALVLAVQSGEKLCDVAQMQYSRCRVAAYSNAVHDLKTMKTLKLDSGNFSKPTLEAFTFNKKVYALAFGWNANVSGLFYNADLVAQYASKVGDPMKLYKAGNWTEDIFYDMLRAISQNSSGKVTPLEGNTAVIGSVFDSNAGGTTVKNGNKVTFAGVSENGVAGLNYAKKLYDEKLWLYPVANKFIGGTAAFIKADLGTHKNYQDIKNLEFVPWPKGLQGKHINELGDGIAWCVPKTVKRKDYVGTILNALGNSSKELIEQEIRILEDNGFSEDSIAVAKWLNENHQLAMTAGPDISLYSEKIDNSVFVANIQPAAAMESIRGPIQKIYDDYYKEFLR